MMGAPPSGAVDARWLAAAKARIAPILAAWENDPALLAATMAIGFSESVARRGLDAEIEAWRDTGTLDAVMTAELLGIPLNRLPETILIVAARTLPASAMRQILWSRILGAHTIVKAASGQEGLGQALCLVGHSAGAGLEAMPVVDRDADIDAAITRADAVVVLGSDTTIATLRARTPPAKAFVAYGHRISTAILPPTPDDTTIACLADDVRAWDRSGCLSPAMVWTEASDPTAMAARLAEKLRTATVSPDPAAAMQRRIIRTRAAMQGRPTLEAGAFVLVIDGPNASAPADTAEVSVRRFDTPAFDGFLPVFSTVGVAKTDLPRWRARLADDIRVAPLGTMQTPPLDWRQDGLRPLQSLLRPSAA